MKTSVKSFLKNDALAPIIFQLPLPQLFLRCMCPSCPRDVSVGFDFFFFDQLWISSIISAFWKKKSSERLVRSTLTCKSWLQRKDQQFPSVMSSPKRLSNPSLEANPKHMYLSATPNRLSRWCITWLWVHMQY